MPNNGSYPRRLERVRKSLSGGAAFDTTVHEQYVEEWREGKRQIARRARELRAARDRGEELSDPFDRQPGAEVQAHIVSYGSLEAAPPELLEEFGRRILPEGAGAYREQFIELAACGLHYALAHFDELEQAT